MTKLALYEVAREPDVALSVRGASRGFNLLSMAQDSQSVTSSPAALLLSPAQATAIPPLGLLPPSKAKKVPGLFDTLHDRLLVAFQANNFTQVAQQASAFLIQHPIAPMAQRSATEQKIRSFFIHKGKASTVGERLALFDSMSQTDVAVWIRTAAIRIDLEKAQILATAVSGIAPPKDTDLLGGIKADLAFCVLIACTKSMGKRQDRNTIPIKYVDQILDMAVFLPALVFELEVCRTRNDDPVRNDGTLSRKVSRLKAYQDRMKKVISAATAAHAAAGLGNAGEGKGDAPASDPAPTKVETSCVCDCGDPLCVPINPCCGAIGWYVTELLTLKDKTHCYKPSDIAYIENVAPYETRIRTHGFARTVTETSEDEINSSREEGMDHQVTDRFNLQKEIQNNQKAHLDVDATLSGKIYGQKYTINTKAGLSKESAYREAREEAREAVDKATLKIQVQTRSLRTRSVSTTTTETNKHKFQNTTAMAAVSKYFWVTQEKRGQLFGHGPAVTVELFIPSPAMLFLAMEKQKRKRGEPVGPPEAPKKPSMKIGLSGTTRDLQPSDITPATYIAIAAEYGVTGYDSPPPTPSVGNSQTIGVQGTAKDGTAAITIPAGYTATRMDFASEDVKWRVSGNWISFKFGGREVKYIVGTGASPGTVNLSERNSGQAIISKGSVTLGKSSIGVTLMLTPDPPVEPDRTAWQASIYTLIMAKYEADLKEYQNKLADYEAALAAYNEKMDEKIKGRHPFACEEIMRTEMKRSAIFMLCGEFDWPGVMNMKAEPCGLPWPDRQKAETATKEWYFFDRAFDWNRASFTFFDYFRNPMCTWVDTFEPDEPNFLFKAFKRAGYAKIAVPVSPGMEEDVKTYLQTGGLWGASGTWPSNPNDPRWISVIDEIKHSHDCYQQDREGYLEAYPNPGDGTFDSHVRVFTDRYWDVLGNAVDQDAINLDIDHQIYIDGIEYRIISIVPDAGSALYNPSPASTMSWIFGLERKVEFLPHVDATATMPILKPYNYAIGAKYVGAPFHFDLPTDLIWIGDQGNACLPFYPIDCVCAPPLEQVHAVSDSSDCDEYDTDETSHAEDE